jgi:hypothetical protein
VKNSSDEVASDWPITYELKAWRNAAILTPAHSSPDDRSGHRHVVFGNTAKMLPRSMRPAATMVFDNARQAIFRFFCCLCPQRSHIVVNRVARQCRLKKKRSSGRISHGE